MWTLHCERAVDGNYRFLVLLGTSEGNRVLSIHNLEFWALEPSKLQANHSFCKDSDSTDSESVFERRSLAKIIYYTPLFSKTKTYCLKDLWLDLSLS